ncbi:hypothetical protein MTR67_034952 [Solanum verrucosum]|uniref:Retrotransposon gag domain-containing protein n=1 Tax=Solanum verrucosum TaxID=315347 RepID=A0AAF0ZJR1_SOLVR|nr:hypothetical protein MTR67_034952 [Solanum verrucosum]
MGPIEWERLKSAFLDRFFPLEMREALVLEFIKFRQGNMSVKEYALRFTQFSKYAPSLVADSRSRMSKCQGKEDKPKTKAKAAPTLAKNYPRAHDQWS